MRDNFIEETKFSRRARTCRGPKQECRRPSKHEMTVFGCLLSVLLLFDFGGTRFCVSFQITTSFPRIRNHRRQYIAARTSLFRTLQLSSSSDQEVLSSSSRNDTASLLVPMDSAAATAAAPTSSFGDVVRRPKASPGVNPLLDAPVALAIPSEERQVAQQVRFRNTIVAVLSVAFALAHFVWQYLHPVEPIQILYQLQQSSADISVIGKNGKPTIVDFWAPWCENCKLSAATLRNLEAQYGKDVNFVLINGDLAANGEYVDALGVDAIPHMAFISYDGVVETALIGPVPSRVAVADIEALLVNQRNHAAAISTSAESRHVELPFQMLDVFAGRPESARRIQFGR